MRRFLVCSTLAFLAVASSFGPAIASGSRARDRGTKPAVNWGQHDTAVYVVSTLNLLRSKRGHTLVSYVESHNGVTRFDVYDDNISQNIYFIQLKTSTGSLVGGFAYEMGWSRPESLSALFDRFHIRRAPDSVVRAYGADAKTLIGSFSSTLPAA